MAGAKKIKVRKIRKEGAIKELEENFQELVENKVNDKKVGTRKIRMSLTKAEEKKMDKAIENDDKMSVTVMVFILLICFVIGISLGYILYRIAINGAI